MDLARARATHTRHDMLFPMRKSPLAFPDRDALFRHGGCPDADAATSSISVPALTPLALPAGMLPTLRQHLLSICRYPDPGCRKLTNRLAILHSVDASQVLVGNGSNELIHLITRALRPSRVAIVEPTYTEYLRAALLAGATTEHWLPDNDQFRPQPFDPEGADLVWLCNPNNPTAFLWPRDAAHHLADNLLSNYLRGR